MSLDSHGERPKNVVFSLWHAGCKSPGMHLVPPSDEATQVWQRAVWCLMLHSRLLAEKSAPEARRTRLLGAVEAMNRATHGDRHQAIAALRSVAAQEGGLVETALTLAEEAA